MLREILMTQDFDLAFQQLQPQKRAIVKRKIHYLLTNPFHSSLNAHRVKQAGENIWECYIDQGMRLLYEIRQNTLRLWYLGGHVLVDRAHKLSFSGSARFLLWEFLPDSSSAQNTRNAQNAPTPDVSDPAYRDARSYAAASRPPGDSAEDGNVFAYFREAYLHVLGVPDELVKSVKEAQTMKDFDILEEQIKVFTIHSAKGLEFPVIFLMGLVEGNLPYAIHQFGQDEEEAQLEIERERMLCYVGMTRAAERLYLVTVRGQESRFVRELAGKIEA